MKVHAEKIAPYTGTELPVITVTDAIMKKDETAHFRTATALKEIKTGNLGYSEASHGMKSASQTMVLTLHKQTA